MTVTEHIGLLQGFNASIGDVRKAPTTYPQSISVTPMVLVFAGTGNTWMDTFASGENRAWGMTERIYNVRVYVSKVGGGSLGSGIGEVNRYIDLFQTQYLRICNQGLRGEGTEGEYPIISMDESQPGTDTGSGVLDYGKELYHGFEFNVRISDQIRETA